MLKTPLGAVIAAAVLAPPMGRTKDGCDRHVAVKNRTDWTMLR